MGQRGEPIYFKQRIKEHEKQNAEIVRKSYTSFGKSS